MVKNSIHSMESSNSIVFNMPEEIQFEYRMDYDPEKKLYEIKKAIAYYIDFINNNFEIILSTKEILQDAERIVLLYNEIIHSEGKSFLDYENAYVSRSKVIAATHFAIMSILPLKKEELSDKFSIQKLNSSFCWFVYLCLVIDFPSKSDKTRNFKFDTESNKKLNQYKEDYLKWLSIKKNTSRPVLITSWFIDLFTEKFFVTN